MKALNINILKGIALNKNLKMEVTNHLASLKIKYILLGR